MERMKERKELTGNWYMPLSALTPALGSLLSGARVSFLNFYLLYHQH